MAGRGSTGSTADHSSSVRSLGYRFVFFSMAAIRPRVARVHIPSLNHAEPPPSSLFQTDSYREGFEHVERRSRFCEVERRGKLCRAVITSLL
jgi:hypothetical protein